MGLDRAQEARLTGRKVGHGRRLRGVKSRHSPYHDIISCSLTVEPQADIIRARSNVSDTFPALSRNAVLLSEYTCPRQSFFLSKGHHTSGWMRSARREAVGAMIQAWKWQALHSCSFVTSVAPQTNYRLPRTVGNAVEIEGILPQGVEDDRRKVYRCRVSLCFKTVRSSITEASYSKRLLQNKSERRQLWRSWKNTV